MSIVDAEHPPAAQLVQGQRIGNAMRPLCIGWHPSGLDFDPVPAADLGEESIEVEQTVEALIVPRHMIMISENDNKCKIISYAVPSGARRRTRSRKFAVRCVARCRSAGPDATRLHLTARA